MKTKLYEWCVLRHPAKDKEDEQETEVVLEVSRDLAADQNELAMRIARQIPDEYMKEAYRLEVAIRPF